MTEFNDGGESYEDVIHNFRAKEPEHTDNEASKVKHDKPQTNQPSRSSSAVGTSCLAVIPYPRPPSPYSPATNTTELFDFVRLRFVSLNMPEGKTFGVVKSYWSS